MNRNTNLLALPAVFLLSLGLLGGCATNQEALEQLRSDVDTSTSGASEAKDAANSAQRSADDAMSAATRAQRSADDASGIANDALREARQASSATDSNRSAIDELNEKIDRMFKKAMNK